ncbi:MAG: glycosyltransferase family 39 protein, partial [bacterium]|nr:glycosyltransferase family 39 protein [bacterium]
MTNFLKNNKWLLIIFALFIFTRFLGLGQIYHQDEYRWASIANPFFGDIASPHPPLSENLYKFVGRIFGFDYLRIVPFMFSFLNLILIYFISLKISKNNKIALIAVGLFAINIYSLIANLQIDIDGAILPFFVLLTYYAYLHILEEGKRKERWLVLLGLAVIGGFLTKLSFLLFIAVLILDQGLRVYDFKERSFRYILRRLWPWIFGFLAIGSFFYYFYASNSGKIIDYAKHFNSLNFASRAYFDLVFKMFKSVVWLSPLLALSVLRGLFTKDTLRKYQIWFMYLFLNLVFYLVLFDFSTLTIERYFMFLIIPAVLISAQVIYDLLERQPVNKRVYVIAGVVFVLLSYVVLSLPHDVIPLNPKEAYVDKVKSLEFNFLIPFTGGSGPSGFYFSAWFILLAWMIACVSLLGAVINK